MGSGANLGECLAFIHQNLKVDPVHHLHYFECLIVLTITVEGVGSVLQLSEFLHHFLNENVFDEFGEVFFAKTFLILTWGFPVRALATPS